MSDTTTAAGQAPAGTTTTTTTGDATQTQATTPTPADVAAQQAAQQTTTDGQQQTQAQQVDTSGWPTEAREQHERQQRIIADLRRENGDQRINAKAKAAEDARAEAAKLVAKALGLEADETPTVDSVQAEAASRTAERDAARLDAALAAAAWAAGIDPARADYLEFTISKTPEYKAIDPTDAAAMGATLQSLVAAAVAADKSLARAVPTATTTAETHAGGTQAQHTPEAFAAMSMAERQELHRTNPDEYRRLRDA